MLSEAKERLKACFDPVARDSVSRRRPKEVDGTGDEGRDGYTADPSSPIHVCMLVMLHHIRSLSPAWIADWILFVSLFLYASDTSGCLTTADTYSAGKRPEHLRRQSPVVRGM